MQVASSITYLPSPSEIALTGHASAHAPQEMQASVIVYAITGHLHIFDTYILAQIRKNARTKCSQRAPVCRKFTIPIKTISTAALKMRRRPAKSPASRKSPPRYRSAQAARNPGRLQHTGEPARCAGTPPLIRGAHRSVMQHGTKMQAAQSAGTADEPAAVPRAYFSSFLNASISFLFSLICPSRITRTSRAL